MGDEADGGLGLGLVGCSTHRRALATSPLLVQFLRVTISGLWSGPLTTHDGSASDRRFWTPSWFLRRARIALKEPARSRNIESRTGNIWQYQIRTTAGESFQYSLLMMLAGQSVWLEVATETFGVFFSINTFKRKVKIVTGLNRWIDFRYLRETKQKPPSNQQKVIISIRSLSEKTLSSRHLHTSVKCQITKLFPCYFWPQN